MNRATFDVDGLAREIINWSFSTRASSINFSFLAYQDDDSSSQPAAASSRCTLSAGDVFTSLNQELDPNGTIVMKARDGLFFFGRPSATPDRIVKDTQHGLLDAL